MTTHWIDNASATLAAAVGDDPARYTLAQAEIDAVLDLARHAAHASGARSNAPLLCYLAGIAHVRHPDRPLSDLADVFAPPAA